MEGSPWGVQSPLRASGVLAAMRAGPAGRGPEEGLGGGHLVRIRGEEVFPQRPPSSQRETGRG